MASSVSAGFQLAEAPKSFYEHHQISDTSRVVAYSWPRRVNTAYEQPGFAGHWIVFTRVDRRQFSQFSWCAPSPPPEAVLVSLACPMGLRQGLHADWHDAVR